MGYNENHPTSGMQMEKTPPAYSSSDLLILHQYGLYCIWRKGVRDRTAHNHCWHVAHVGDHGNELADGEAKAAAESPSVSLDLPVSSSRFKCKLKSIMIQAWQDHWEFTPNKGRFTSSIIPKVSLKSHFWGEMAELFTGHGRFPAHLFRFGIGYHDRCACGAVGDAKHYIVRCPLTGDLRARLRFNPLDLSSLVRDFNLPVLGEIGRRVRTFLLYVHKH
ncbi:hypothetical protein AVEN_190490-1 [Araneus ventricosus]|uniref:RNase H type-1 domain-containing protein n=1 Tax=Araneus ventricosus TaxID=182803 RepID=A0A4Y2JFN7_ARAVE|nr:hypothetical protein AVEN_190490-1 [Araneus ventricosus]